MWKKITTFNPQDFANELLERGKRDQDVRMRMDYTDDSPDNPVLKEMLKVDRDNTDWLRSHVEQFGFPGISTVGEEGAASAWAIAQHSPDDDFRATALQHMEANPKDHRADLRAIMTDRVLRDQGKPQLYGTQYETKDGKNVPFPIQDPDKVDELRKSMGMGPLKDYLEEK